MHRNMGTRFLTDKAVHRRMSIHPLGSPEWRRLSGYISRPTSIPEDIYEELVKEGKAIEGGLLSPAENVTHTDNHDAYTYRHVCDVCGQRWEASEDASLGVGHIWTTVSCPAYRTLNPDDCNCQEKA